MSSENMIRLLAGSMVLIGLILSHLVNPWWELLAAFVGLNLIQSVFTGICPAEMIIKKLGIASSCCGGKNTDKSKNDDKPCCGGH